jgi:hypothetical protein
MAQLLQPDGTTTEMRPAHGAEFTLDELQTAVGNGYIEAVYLEGGRVMFVNEDGKRLALSINPQACALAHAAHAIYPTDVIVGPAIICGPEEIS